MSKRKYERELMPLLWKGNQFCVGRLGELSEGEDLAVSAPSGCLGSPAVLTAHDRFSGMIVDVYSKPRVTWSRVTQTERGELCLKDQICAPIFGPPDVSWLRLRSQDVFFFFF